MTRLRASENPVVRPEGVEEGSVVTVFRVPPEVSGQRVDLFLQSQLKRTSRTRAQEILRLSAYDGSGRRLRPGSRVHTEQFVVLWRAPWDEQQVPTELPILYEDEHLLAVDKPAGLPVHPSARYHKNTLINLLKAQRPEQFVSLGHRLDRETSGVILVSKSKLCDRSLKRQLQLRDGIEKTYRAITWGVPGTDPEVAETTARTPAGAGPSPAPFRVEARMELDRDSRYQVKMRVGAGPESLSAATGFTVEGVARAASGRAYARVRCDLETGRQHQIRVHLAHGGTPIVGDKLYGPDDGCFARNADNELTGDDLALMELPRHALHAARLSLPHPITGAPLVVEAPFPADLAAFWDALPAG